MLSGIFHSTHTPTRIEQYPELKEALHLIEKLHYKADELKKSAHSKGPTSIEQRKYEILSNLLNQIDKAIQDFNDNNIDGTNKDEMSQLINLIHKLCVLIDNTCKTNDYTLLLSRNKHREVASKVVYGSTFAATFAAGSSVFFSPLGMASFFYIAPHVSDKMGELTGLNDISPESMRLLNRLYKKLSALDQQFKRNYLNEKESKEDSDIEDFKCPISLSIMTDPVICTLDGRTYEKAEIEKWLAMKKTSPITRAKIPVGKSIQDVLIPNRNLKAVIERFLAKNPTASENDFVPEEKSSAP